ncbi:MAG: carbohydrate kinase [Solobacterium sp.]|jgi:autoinducer 2 (AI-2) kinase|nr:carbohydrate kinase [Solobacterium sp.]MCH4048619.1 carbohydrate kinase [Solobacterium sp.]MCH4075690.1 carbohydrate kinase [Solobacterium sp.]
MKHYLMFDMGTGNSRVSLVSSDGKILGLRNFSNTYYRDNSYEDGQYFVPNEWADKLLGGCRDLCRQFPDILINGISAAGARQSFVLIDRDGDAFIGLPNIDNRGRAYMSPLKQYPDIYSISGKWITEDFGAGKLLGFRKVYPDQYARIAKITSLSEWIGYLLTGCICMEYSQASESQLYDIQKKDWSEKLCEYYGFDMMILPELKAGGTILAKIDKKYQSSLNLSDDAVFIVGGADTQTAIRQTDVSNGDIAIVSGTTSPIVSLTEKYINDPYERLWMDADLGGNRFLMEMNPGVTGMNYQRMKDAFCPDLSYDQLENYYDGMTEYACTASFNSLLFYQKHGFKYGGFFMRSPLQANVNRQEMMYAVLGDIACGIYEELWRNIKITGNNPERIYGCGGGFQSKTLCNMIASLANKKLVLKHGYNQATVLGLVNIANSTFCEKSGNHSEIVEYEPDPNNLIHRYYKKWLENRNRIIEGD